MIKASQVRLNSTAETPADEAEILNILPLATFKAEFRIRHNIADENTRMTNAIKEAYYRLDGPTGWLNRAILEQQWKGFVDDFDDEIEVPLPPIQQVDTVRYRDEDGDWQTLSTDVYGVDTSGLFARIYLKKDQSWPDVYADPASVEITFTAGWGDGATVLTSAYMVSKAMKLLAGHYYHNPTPTFVEPRLVEVPRKIQYGLENILGQIRIVNDHS